MKRTLRVANDRGRSEPFRVKFTKTTIERLPSPAKGRQLFYDEMVPGLAICVSATGSRVFYRYGRIDGRPSRYRIGAFPDISIEQARKAVAKLNGEIADGKDPRLERTRRRTEPTLGDAWGYYLEHRCKPKLRERTWKEYERQYNKWFKGWSARRVGSIRKSEVVTLHLEISIKAGPYEANRVATLLRAIVERLIKDERYSGKNPADRIERFQETERDRFLSPNEIARLFKALDDEDELLRDYITLLLFIGSRRTNLLKMRWEEVDLSASVWRIPDTKSRRPQTVPLVGAALELLQLRKDAAGGSPWVFPGAGKAGHMPVPNRDWVALRNRVGIPDVRLHDLRRTMGSWQAGANVSMTIVGKTLGHRSSRSTEIYARLDLDPVREAMEKAVGLMLAAGRVK